MQAVRRACLALEPQLNQRTQSCGREARTRHVCCQAPWRTWWDFHYPMHREEPQFEPSFETCLIAMTALKRSLSSSPPLPCRSVTTSPATRRTADKVAFPPSSGNPPSQKQNLGFSYPLLAETLFRHVRVASTIRNTLIRV